MKRTENMKSILARCARFLLCLIAAALLCPATARADMGPKPSVCITFENMGDEVCYGTLLSERSSTGPASAWDGDEDHIYNYGLDLDIWRAFAEYEDTDGYYFLQEGWLVSESKGLNWGYYPPSPFKILLYYPEQDAFVVSGICQRYAFDSYFTVDMEGIHIGAVQAQEAVLRAERSYDYTWELISLGCRIALTILLELCVALLFGFRQKRLLSWILWINLVTQAALNLGLNVIRYQQGQMAFLFGYVCLELLVFALEAVLYSLLFPKISQRELPGWKPALYALVANGVSFAGGLLIAKWIPGIF